MVRNKNFVLLHTHRHIYRRKTRILGHFLAFCALGGWSTKKLSKWSPETDSPSNLAIYGTVISTTIWHILKLIFTNSAVPPEIQNCSPNGVQKLILQRIWHIWRLPNQRPYGIYFQKYAIWSSILLLHIVPNLMENPSLGFILTTSSFISLPEHKMLKNDPKYVFFADICACVCPIKNIW